MIAAGYLGSAFDTDSGPYICSLLHRRCKTTFFWRGFGSLLPSTRKRWLELDPHLQITSEFTNSDCYTPVASNGTFLYKYALVSPVWLHGTCAARLFLVFSFPCSADHERDWPCKVVFSGWQPTLNVRNQDFSLNNPLTGGCSRRSRCILIFL